VLLDAPSTVTVATDPEHGAVARQRATEAPRRERLRATATLLGELHNPGLVELVGLRDPASGPTELLTRWVGATTLADDGRRRPTEVAGLVAAVASTVAELHRSGVAHRQLRADHVLVDGGHPVLCGLSRAGAGPAADLATDMTDLGQLLLSLLTRCPRGIEPAAQLRLRRLARLATTTPPLLDAAGLATGLSQVRGARLPRAVPAPAGEPRGRHGRSVPVAPRAQRIAAAAALALGALLTNAGWARLQPARGHLAAHDPTATPARPAAAGCARGAARPSAGTALHLDLDGDGCPETVAIDGPRLTVDGTRYTLGRPGDVIALGMWGATPVPSPALLRPSSGAVYVFRSWPGPGHDVTARPRTVVPGATSLSVRHRPGRPDQLLVRRPRLAAVVLTP
jgi:hypothetical protein